jgi:hypothetical protein
MRFHIWYSLYHDRPSASKRGYRTNGFHSSLPKIWTSPNSSVPGKPFHLRGLSKARRGPLFDKKIRLGNPRGTLSPTETFNLIPRGRLSDYSRSYVGRGDLGLIIALRVREMSRIVELRDVV